MNRPSTSSPYATPSPAWADVRREDPDRNRRSVVPRSRVSVRRVRHAPGVSQNQPVRRFGPLAVSHIPDWVRAHRRGGDAALEARRRGRRGGHTKLTQHQQEKIARLVVGNNLDQLKLPGFSWTRALVRDLIRQRYSIEVGKTPWDGTCASGLTAEVDVPRRRGCAPLAGGALPRDRQDVDADRPDLRDQGHRQAL